MCTCKGGGGGGGGVRIWQEFYALIVTEIVPGNTHRKQELSGCMEASVQKACSFDF